MLTYFWYLSSMNSCFSFRFYFLNSIEHVLYVICVSINNLFCSTKWVFVCVFVWIGVCVCSSIYVFMFQLKCLKHKHVLLLYFILYLWYPSIHTHTILCLPSTYTLLKQQTWYINENVLKIQNTLKYTQFFWSFAVKL